MQSRFFLLRELIKRDFKARYVGSAFGFLWSFALPVWQLVLFTFVFAGVMGIRLPEDVLTGSFAVFIFSGLLPWTALNEGVARATTAITDNAGLVSKLRFPSEVLIVTVIGTALAHEAIAGTIFVAYLGVTGSLSVSTLPGLALIVPVQTALTIGLGLLLATSHVYFRDTAQAVGMALFGWFYLTPIVYPISLVPDGMARLIAANPLTTLVTSYRWALLGFEPPQIADIATLLLTTILLFSAGLWLFRRLGPSFVDEL